MICEYIQKGLGQHLYKTNDVGWGLQTCSTNIQNEKTYDALQKNVSFPCLVIINAYFSFGSTHWKLTCCFCYAKLAAKNQLAEFVAIRKHKKKWRIYKDHGFSLSGMKTLDAFGISWVCSVWYNHMAPLRCQVIRVEPDRRFNHYPQLIVRPLKINLSKP